MIGIRALLFKGRKTARKAFETLDEQTEAFAWLDDVAEVSRSKHGHIRIHSTRPHTKLDELAETLENDTSALILATEEETLAHFLSALQPFEGQLYDTGLDENDVKALRKALRKSG